MKACVLEAIGKLTFKDVPQPQLREGQVLIKIKASGICGSDISRVMSKGTYHFPTIPGHEFAGQIIEVGDDIDKRLIGRKATVFPLVPCGKCPLCQMGEYAQCLDYNYFGSRCDGGFAEYISVPLWNVVLVPENLSYKEAAMTEPVSVALHALRQAAIEIGDNVAIFGAGPIGLMLGQWARAWGADKVMLVDIDQEKVNFAKKQGFEFVINSRHNDPVEWINHLTHGKGADVSVEGAGVCATLEQCCLATRPFGKVVVMGNPEGEMRLSQKSYWKILRNQLTIKGTWNSSFAPFPKSDWSLSLRYMELGKINVKPFITHEYRLEQAMEPFHMITSRKEFFNKVMYVE